MAAPQQPLGTRRDRYVVILVGAIAGYVVGRLLEDRMGLSGAMMVTTPAGGLLSGVVARFTLERFRD